MGRLFLCGIDACEVLAERQYPLMWILTGKQMIVFQYQHLFRAMSRHGCSLNDNRFMLACHHGGTGDWHWVQTSWPWCQHSCPDFWKDPWGSETTERHGRDWWQETGDKRLVHWRVCTCHRPSLEKHILKFLDWQGDKTLTTTFVQPLSKLLNSFDRSSGAARWPKALWLY